MSNYNKLQAVLTEVFQLDQADLDFGIYRIMNQKRDAINDFLQNSLPKQVKELLEKNLSGDNVKIQADLDATIKQLKELSVDIDSNPKVKELRAKLEATVSIDALEQEVFSHLANFFKRYYQGGDFISLRRYKKDVYAIPYEGEEVKLHWANHDQYYIKTSEYLKNYAFKLGGEKLVKFQLKEASTEQNNNKTQNDQERRFAIFEELPVEIEGNTLLINFTYEPHKKTVKQDDLTKKAVEAIKAKVPVDFADVFVLAPTESNKQRTLLDKHINNFVARHTFDYFIHKDLGGFLRRELDFYIKNEVLYIDDINTVNEIAFNSQISKIKALKQVANKIILFLEQLENFQKKLWLKKKFVIAANYCITIDRIPTDYYAEIIENKAQLEEWEMLFDVTIKTIKDLENEPFLVLDTKFFSEDFKERLLAEFEDLDEQTNGLLVRSENEQSLRLLLERYKNSVQQIYIDPPYNTGNDDGFVYKDSFQTSSWISMISSRVKLGKEFLNSSGTFSYSIDLKELDTSLMLFDNIFGEENKRNNITIKRSAISGPKVINPGVVNITENILLYSKSLTNWKEIKGFKERERDNRYNTYIENINDDYTNWRYCSVLDAFAKSLNIDKSKLKKHFGDDYEKKIDEFVIENVESVIRYANLDENSVSQEAVRLKKLSIENPTLTYKLERSNKEDYIISNGNVLLFYKNRLIKIGDKYVPGEPLSDIWLDVLPNDLHNEGGVNLRKGKKPEKLVDRILSIGSEENDLVMDFFAGSGTTGGVALKANKKFICVEQGNYFDNLTLRRTKNTLRGEQSGISKLNNWKGGGFVKYIRLEGYEDTLNNLTLQQTQTQQGALALNDKVKEEYLLQYMLDVESQDHLFNLNAFKNPFNYQLNVTENNELVPTTVDLVETFNYLIGLKVRKVERIKEFKLVTGENLKGDKILVIWRNLEKTTNDDLNRFVEKLDIKVFDGEFDIIYVNGDNNLANFKKEEESWKVRLIEEEFFNKMFDVKDI